MRLLHVAILTALAILAASAAGPSADAACLPMVKYKGRYYTGYPTVRTLALGTGLAGVVPACRDVVGQPPGPDRPTRLRAVKGVSANVAVARPLERRLVYVRLAVFPAVRTFPLHNAIYGKATAPNECTGMRLLRLVRLSGKVDAPSTFLLALRTRTGVKQIFVDSRTQLGYRATTPLKAGDRLVVQARDCRNEKTRQHVLVAARISRPLGSR